MGVVKVLLLFPQADQTERVYGHWYSPIVEMKVELNASSENLTKMQVLPTPLSPISSNLNK